MTLSTDIPRSCEKCGATLPALGTAGLCPRCLMAEAMMPTQPGANPAAPTLPPEELAPHFPQLEILECLGRGGMGVVYKARQKSLDRLVALKLLTPERVTDGQFAERFANEAKALAALSHPHIVTIHDFGQAGGFYYLLMEFVDGVNLRQAMRAGRFTPEQALAIVPPVCEALQYAHEKGIVHRDIKPENLLLDRDGRVKIADFGIAKILGGESEAATDGQANREEPAAGAPTPDVVTLASAAGTPHYMAPEQRSGPQRTDSRADIYSLGVVLYEMLTGELPGATLEAPSRKVQIDVRLDEVVLRALEQSPELRYQTAGEMRTMVETIAGAPPPHIAPENPVPPFDFSLKLCTFTSRTAFRVARAGWVLGCLAALGFLGYLPGVPWLKALFGFSGFFGLFGLAVLMELVQRIRHGVPVGTPAREPAAAALTPAVWERTRWFILARAFILCLAGAVFGIHLHPPMIGIAIVAWGGVGFVLVARKALGLCGRPEEDRRAITVAGQIGLVHALGILSAGLFLSRVNSGLSAEWNWFLAAVFGYGIVVCLLKLTGVFKQPVGKSRLVALTLVLGVVALGVFGVMAIQIFRPSGSHASLADSPFELKKHSTEEVIRAGFSKPLNPWAWQELETRTLTAADGAQILDGLTAWLGRDYPQGMHEPLSWLDRFLDELAKRGLVTDARSVRFQEALQGNLRWQPGLRMREGGRQLPLNFECRYIWSNSVLGLVMMNEIREVRVDGRLLPPGRSMTRHWSSTYIGGSVELPALAPGNHRVEVVVLSALAAEADLAGLPSDAPSADWPPARKRWTRTAATVLTVCPRDAVIVNQTQDPALDPLADGGLSVKQMIIRPKGEQAQASLIFDLKDKLPVSVSFDVSLRVAGSSVPCGHLWAATRPDHTVEHQSDMQITAELAALPTDIREADVVLTPNPGYMDELSAVTLIWGKEIVFARVPLTRQDLTRNTPRGNPPAKTADPDVAPWLAALDDGKFAQCWENASDGLRHVITREDWLAAMDKGRLPQGKPQSRMRAVSGRTASVPGMADGSYDVTEFDSTFAGGKTAVETVTFHRENDGRWLAAGYVILPLTADEMTSVKGARDWLGLLDAGGYPQSWDQAAGDFRQSITREKWVDSVAGVRGPMGKMMFRNLRSATHTDRLPGAPAGDCVLMQFGADFAHKKSAVETVTFRKDPDGQWRCAGYYVR